MKITIFSSFLFCILSFISTFTTANDNVATLYDAQKFQQVCKGKAVGDAITFAFKGIIWNGTCENQFFIYPKKDVIIRGDEKELITACKNDPKTEYATLNDSQVKGRCALGFLAPTPKI